MKDSKEEKKDGPVDELWTLKPNMIKEEHFFEYVSGTEVECKDCPLGYGVTADTEIKDGHIYLEGNLVI